MLSHSLEAGTLVKLILSNYHGPDAGLQRLQIRPLNIRGQAHLSWVYRYPTKDLTKNHPLAAGLTLLRELLGSQFRNAHLLTHSDETQLAVSRKGKCSLRIGPASSTPAEDAEAGSARPPEPAQHNRDKQRLIEPDRPFLVELGITSAQHQVHATMSRKWKQINKFVEVFSHAWAGSALPQTALQRAVHVVDFGCGKGYLTFAIHDHLRHRLGVNAQVRGVELRSELVGWCNQAVKKLQLPGLSFEAGDIRSHAPAGLDVMIALHACDVATDFAIEVGIRSGASIIMCSPCCHKEIRPQLLSPHPLRPILQHGVHLGQQAEMLTDGLRALLLEACGYETQVFEFISLEHTNKNKMILAVKRPPEAATAQLGKRQDVLQQIREIKDFYGIKAHCLETLLQQQGLLPVNTAAD